MPVPVEAPFRRDRGADIPTQTPSSAPETSGYELGGKVVEPSRPGTDLSGVPAVGGSLAGYTTEATRPGRSEVIESTLGTGPRVTEKNSLLEHPGGVIKTGISNAADHAGIPDPTAVDESVVPRGVEGDKHLAPTDSTREYGEQPKGAGDGVADGNPEELDDGGGNHHTVAEQQPDTSGAGGGSGKGSDVPPETGGPGDDGGDGAGDREGPGEDEGDDHEDSGKDRWERDLKEGIEELRGVETLTDEDNERLKTALDKFEAGMRPGEGAATETDVRVTGGQNADEPAGGDGEGGSEDDSGSDQAADRLAEEGGEVRHIFPQPETDRILVDKLGDLAGEVDGDMPGISDAMRRALDEGIVKAQKVIEAKGEAGVVHLPDPRDAASGQTFEPTEVILRSVGKDLHNIAAGREAHEEPVDEGKEAEIIDLTEQTPRLYTETQADGDPQSDEASGEESTAEQPTDERRDNGEPKDGL